MRFGELRDLGAVDHGDAVPEHEHRLGVRSPHALERVVELGAGAEGHIRELDRERVRGLGGRVVLGGLPGVVSLRQDRERLERGQKLTHELDPLLRQFEGQERASRKIPRPGRDRLCAIPSATGSPLTAGEAGLSVVARIARIAGPSNSVCFRDLH